LGRHTAQTSPKALQPGRQSGRRQSQHLSRNAIFTNRLQPQLLGQQRENPSGSSQKQDWFPAFGNKAYFRKTHLARKGDAEIDNRGR
jgi:hypothetical protein